MGVKILIIVKEFKASSKMRKNGILYTGCNCITKLI